MDGRGRVRIGTHHYELDLNRYARRPPATTRDQVDQGAEAGESSLASTHLWTRTGRDFTLGAGQAFFDEEDSDRRRFRTSKGIDPWTRRELGLLPDTEQVLVSAEVNVAPFAVDDRLYVVDGAALKHATTGEAPWTATANLSGLPITDVATDGYRLWVADGNEIRAIASPGAAATALSAFDANLVAYANGRLLAANDNVLVEVNGDGTTTAIMSHANPNFVWTCVLGAPNGIYVAGRAGDRAEIYLVGIIDATGQLAAPFWAGDISAGETVQTMAYYGGVVAIGTTVGVALALITGSGYLSAGPRIAIPGGVRCLEPQANFAWFGWADYDDDSTGLGRLRLDRFTDQLVPAWASDLMAPAQGAVVRIASFGGRRYFGVAGSGLWRQADELVASGTYRSGPLTYGVPEAKGAVGVEVRTTPLPAGATVTLNVVDQDGTSTTGVELATTAATGAAADVGTVVNEDLEIELVLARATDPTVGPTVRRWSVRSIALPFRSEEIFLPLQIASTTESREVDQRYVPSAEWVYLKALEESQARVPVEIGSEHFDAYVRAVAIDPDGAKGWNDDDDVEGTVIVQLLRVQVA